MFYIETRILSLLYKHSLETADLYKIISFQFFLFSREEHKISGKDLKNNALSSRASDAFLVAQRYVNS